MELSPINRLESLVGMLDLTIRREDITITENTNGDFSAYITLTDPKIKAILSEIFELSKTLTINMPFSTKTLDLYDYALTLEGERTAVIRTFCI